MFWKRRNPLRIVVPAASVQERRGLKKQFCGAKPCRKTWLKPTAASSSLKLPVWCPTVSTEVSDRRGNIWPLLCDTLTRPSRQKGGLQLKVTLEAGPGEVVGSSQARGEWPARRRDGPGTPPSTDGTIAPTKTKTNLSCSMHLPGSQRGYVSPHSLEDSQTVDAVKETSTTTATLPWSSRS